MQWSCKGKKFHVIRDHERHYDFPMLAAMWGVRGGISVAFKESIEEWAKDASAYLVDQIWLGNKIWLEANARANVFVHGAKEKTLDINGGLDFVGQGYTENDEQIYR